METLSQRDSKVLSPSLSLGERELACEYLEFTKNLLLDSVAGLDGSEWKSRIGPEGWTIAECIEHLALAGDFAWKVLQYHLQQEPTPEKQRLIKVNVRGIICSMTDRASKEVTMALLLPAGNFDEAGSALEHFVRQRQRLIEYVRTTKDELKNRHDFHPTVGTINLYQFILMEGAHSARHVLQIEEIKAAMR